MTITLRRGRNLLALIWITGFVPPFLILAARTFFGTYYGGKDTEAWSWFTPNIIPTMGLILSTLAAGIASKDQPDQEVAPLFFWLTFLFSLFYLLIFNLIFLLEPFTNSAPLETFKRSSLFLGVLQGLVTAVLGVFFVRSARGHEA